jgi:hypothetical protein
VAGSVAGSEGLQESGLADESWLTASCAIAGFEIRKQPTTIIPRTNDLPDDRITPSHGISAL